MTSIQQLEGRQHFVVPMVMMTVGVRNGILYTADELKKSAHLWNGKPVVVYHPVHHGPAGDPGIANRQKIGTVYNARFQDNRLTAEAWIDVERATAVDARVIHAISNNRMLEISTGLYFGNHDKTAPSSYLNESYHTIGRIHIPDHLAILPDQTGACSIADGCGLMRNTKENEMTEEPLGLPTLNALFDIDGQSCGCQRTDHLGLPDMAWDKPSETAEGGGPHNNTAPQPGQRNNAMIAGEPLGLPSMNW